MQSELPKPDTLPDDYEFNLSEFLSDNWFFLVGFLVIVSIVIFYSVYRKNQRKNRID